MEEKFTCTKCKEIKSITDFFKDKNSCVGHDYVCKTCKNKIIKERDPDGNKQRERTHKYAKSDKGFNKRRDRLLKQRYGITSDDYNKILTSQNGVCKICKNSNIGYQNGLLHVDHNHETGKIRGLLCSRCNVGLGAFKDNKELFLTQ